MLLDDAPATQPNWHNFATVCDYVLYKFLTKSERLHAVHAVPKINSTRRRLLKESCQ